MKSYDIDKAKDHYVFIFIDLQNYRKQPHVVEKLYKVKYVHAVVERLKRTEYHYVRIK